MTNAVHGLCSKALNYNNRLVLKHSSVENFESELSLEIELNFEID